MRRLSVIALLLLAPACDRGPEEPSPEVLAARQEASRLACVANELLRRAQDQLQTLEASLAAGAETSAGLAVVEYARAYLQHAELRAAAYAQLDSAASASARQADSIRHAQAAARFTIRAPEAGTVEANVLQAYERDLAALLSDPDHPCNWEDR